MTLRFQPRWIVEGLSQGVKIETIFIPFVPHFSSLNWLCHKDFKLFINQPLASQAMVLRAWLQKSDGLSDYNRQKFNQHIRFPLDMEKNPFRIWKDIFFDYQQLDYLFYWREAAYEIEDESQREIFLSIVYQIVLYWISCRKQNAEAIFQPDEIMGYYLSCHKKFVEMREADISITNFLPNEVKAEEVDLVILPLIFSEDMDNLESEIQTLFYTWYRGDGDLIRSKQDIKGQIGKYIVSLQEKPDFRFYYRLVEKAGNVGLTWSGKDLPPAFYEQEVVIPLRNIFLEHYKCSKLYMKCVDKMTDSYDYSLVFY